MKSAIIRTSFRRGEPEIPQKEENRIIPHLPANMADYTIEAHLLVPFQSVDVRDEEVLLRVQQVPFPLQQVPVPL